MKGSIIKKYEHKYFTYMGPVLAPIREIVREYNWLITDCDIYWYPDKRIGNPDYDWLPGDVLLEIVERYDIQFVWGVFSAIPKDVPLEQVLLGDAAGSLPCADGNGDFWKLPVSMQHPLAEIEIVAFDSSLTLIISEHDALIDKWAAAFPHSEDLEAYITEFAK